jgi:hypothetical protein
MAEFDIDDELVEAGVRALRVLDNAVPAVVGRVLEFEQKLTEELVLSSPGTSDSRRGTHLLLRKVLDVRYWLSVLHRVCRPVPAVPS